MKKMDVRNDPIPRFISRMFETPALRALPALQKEEQALQFLRQNSLQLQPLLASMGIAAAAGWQETIERLVREIRSLADGMLERRSFEPSRSDSSLRSTPPWAQTGNLLPGRGKRSLPCADGARTIR